jgi:hypothetical protein
MVSARTVIAGGALYVGAAGTAYWYVKSHQQAAQPAAHTDAPACGCAFERLAPCYDATVGSEEAWMGYGFMRSWMLRGLKVRPRVAAMAQSVTTRSAEGLDPRVAAGRRP